MIALAGGKTPEYMQGNSFKSILETGEEPDGWQQETYYRYWMHMAHKHNNPAHFGIRTKKYKLIFFYGRDYTKSEAAKRKNGQIILPLCLILKLLLPGNFTTLLKDPNEMDNRYGQPEYEECHQRLKTATQKLKSQSKRK